MKRLITFLICIFYLIICRGQGNYPNATNGTGMPIKQSMASDSTLLGNKGVLWSKFGFVNGIFTDTTSANLTHIKNYAGAQIFCTNADILWIRDLTATVWINMGGGAGGNSSITNIYNNSIVNIFVYNDSCVIFETGSGNNDTLCTQFNCGITGWSIINSTQIEICGFICPDTTTIICDTFSIPPSPLYLFDNWLGQRIAGLTEFGGRSNTAQPGYLLSHDTYANTGYNKMNFLGYRVYDYPYVFTQQQSFQNGSGLISVLSPGNKIYNHINTVRLGFNFTGDTLVRSPFQAGYFGQRNGYWLGTNLTSNGSFGLNQDDNTSKNTGIFFGTGTGNTDGVIIYAQPAQGGTYVSGLSNNLVANFKTDLSVQYFGYGSGSSFISTDTTNIKPLGVDANGNQYRLDRWPGSGGGSLSIGTINSQTKNSNGAVISGSNLYMQTINEPTDNPGLLPNYKFNQLRNKIPKYQASETFINSSIVRKWNAATFAEYRDGATCLNIRDSALLFFGGWNGVVDSTVLAKVFISTDGVNWSYLYSMPWGAMHSFALFLADDGYYYEMGGDYLSNSTQKKSVWRSPNPLDSTSWTRQTSTAAFSTILYEATSHNDTLFFMGGQQSTAYADGASDTVWRSTDGGVNWVFHAKIAGNVINKNISHTGAWFGDWFYLVGGGRYDQTIPASRTYDSTVYKTNDFRTFIAVPPFPYRGLQYPGIKVWDGKLWVWRGDSVGGANTPFTGYLTKSEQWQVATNYDSSGVAISNSHAPALVVWKDQLLSINANADNKTWALARSTYLTNQNSDISFLTAISADTINTDKLNGVTRFGSKYTGSFVESFNMSAVSNQITTSAKLVLNRAGLEQAIIGNTGQSSAYVTFRNSSNSNGIIEYNNTSWDVYYNNVLSWRYLSTGKVRYLKYGVGTFTGTPAYTLQVDASGNIIEGDKNGVNIYNSDGTLAGNRIVDLSNKTIKFIDNSTGQFGLYLRAIQGDFILGDTISSNATPYFWADGATSTLKSYTTNGWTYTSGGNIGLDINELSTSGDTGNGLRVTVAGSATTITGAQFSASGGSNNYAILVPTGKGNVGIGTSTPSSSALVELASTTQAFIVMRMTATQASAITAAAGMMLFVTDTNGTFTSVGFWGYDGSTWAKF